MKPLNLDLSQQKQSSMACRYCKRECNHTICPYCDGKHTARRISGRLSTERNIAAGRGQSAFFNEGMTLEFLKKRDILGLEGLTQGERQEFMSGYNAEYAKLKGGV